MEENQEIVSLLKSLVESEDVVIVVREGSNEDIYNKLTRLKELVEVGEDRINPQLLYVEAMKRWGKGSQIEMFIEEISELILALQKFKREPTLSSSLQVCDEMADVSIMLEQCSLIFSEKEIGERRRFKLDRLQTTLKNTLYEKYQMDENKINENT